MMITIAKFGVQAFRARKLAETGAGMGYGGMA